MHIVRREERIDPTWQTVAKLRQPIWQAWEPDLVAAAKEIEFAIRIIAGGSLVRVGTMEARIDREWRPDLSKLERSVVVRYGHWRRAMEAERCHVGYVVGILGCDEPVPFPGLLMHALRLYAKVNFAGRGQRRRVS
jgi:hypothetical protein